MSELYQLPGKGESSETVLAKIRAFRAAMTPAERGKLSSTAFQGRDEMGQLVYASFMEFLGWNGLFTFQEPAAAQLENDVLDICIGLVSGGYAVIQIYNRRRKNRIDSEKIEELGGPVN